MLKLHDNIKCDVCLRCRSTEQDSLNESHSLAFGQLDNDSEMINDKENLVKNLDSLVRYVYE